jgi:hypothetical protein
VSRAALLVILLAACGNKSTDTGTTTKSTPPTQEQALAGWETVRSVLQHPRCQNCHPADDIPLQGDQGQPHNQMVQRGADGFGEVGARCQTCHGNANPPASYGAHTPPGNAKGWHMPKPEMPMVFVGRSSGALCAQIKDPAQNDHKDMAALRTHLDDPLVLWGWEPGFGRTPVPVPHADFVAAFETWAAGGAPCPAP